MINKSLKEAREQFDVASKVLMEDYGIMPHQFQGETPEDVYAQGIPEDEGESVSLKGDSKIAQIREIALQGLQEYARDVDTEKYQFYKKVWLMCDKAVSEKESVGDAKD